VSASSAANEATAANQWTGQYGQLASTTGNVSGIYDMSGGNYERVASYNNSYSKTGNYFGGTGGNTNVTYRPATGVHFAFNIHPNSDKYATKYTNSTSTYNVTAFSNFYTDSKDVSHTGDAIHEVWRNSYYAWNSDYSDFVHSTYPFFNRGDYYFNGTNAGVFASNFNYGGGSSVIGFRACLVQP